jgi:hypothetical protein
LDPIHSRFLDRGSYLLCYSPIATPAIESAVAPIAFGPSAILGTGCFEMIAETRHIATATASSNALAVFIFVASGALGAYLAILSVRYFRTRKPMAERGRLEADSRSGNRD